MESTIKETLNTKQYYKSQEKESWISNTFTFFDSSNHTFKLLMKSHFTGSSFYLGNLLIPILITIGVLAFMPPYVGISWMAFLSLTFAGLSTYGTLFFTLRKSTIIKNVSMTANETGTLYFATFWSIFVSIMCTLIIIILTIFTLDKLGFVMDAVGSGIFNDSQAYKIDYTQIWWSILLYYAIMQALVCFSMSFFIEQLVSTQKNFFIFAFVYILAGIFFSGMISSTMYIHDGKVNIIDLENINKGELDGIMVIDELQWGKPMWIVGQFFPHYGLNQWVWNSLSAGAYHVPEVGERVYNPWNSVNLFDTLNSTKGAYYFWAPIVWSGLLLTASGAMERYQED